MSNNQEHEIRLLLERVAADDRQAFTRLYHLLYTQLFRYVLVITKSEHIAEEILQELFIKLWIKRQTLVGIVSLESYCLTMLRNHIFDLKRRQRTVTEVDLILAEASGQNNVTEQLLFNEYHRIAMKAIQALPERRREIFLLNAQDGFKASEIATHYKMSLTAVKKQLYLANHFIRDYLKEHGEFGMWAFLLSVIFS